MPFKSDKQRRYLWSQKPEVAKQIAHKQTGGGVYSDGLYDQSARWHNARLAGIPQHVGFIDDPDNITETAASNPDDPYGGKYINPDRKAPLGKYTDLATYYTAKERALGRGEKELARMAAVNEELKKKAAAQGFKFNDGGEVPMMDNRKPKKITQKDRYGNQVSVEYTDEQKPFDINSLFEKLLDQPVPEMLTIPESSPVGGGVSIGFGSTHPGEPRGSDTVPAWLTPGEFVVNKEAMDDPQNAAAVKAINDQGRQVQQMKHGGPLQMHRMSGGVPMDGATHMNQGGDTRGFFDRLKLLAGFEDTPPVPQPEQPVPQSLPMSPEQTLIRSREGYRPEVYEDTRGFNTVGFGDRTDHPIGSVPYTREQNEARLDDNIGTAQAAAENYAGDKWKDLNKQQKAALTSMALQLGRTGQAEFEEMQKALKAGDWAGVRREARDSLWAGQTPARVEDIEAAFRYGGGPIYAQSGTGIPNFGGPVMWDPETQSYVPQEQLMPDILAGQEEGAAQAVQDSQAITDQLNQEDLDMYGWNQAEGRPNTRDEATAAGLYTPEVPPFEAPTHTPEAVAKDDSEYQQRLAQQIAQAENMVAGGDGDDLGNLGGVPDVPPEKWYEGITDWAFGDEGTEVARARNAAFDAKAAAENLKDANETVAELEARVDNGQPVNSHTLAMAKEAQEHQQEQVVEAEIENAQLNEYDMQAEYEAASGFQAEQEALAAANLEEANEPGPEDDRTTLWEFATNEEGESEDAPDKPSEKGQQSTEEVITAGEEAAKTDPSKIDKAKGFFKSAFSDLFDGKELARMAIMYAGSRALGYSHMGSLNWAAKQYAGRLEAKETNRTTYAQELAKTGKYTAASTEAYRKTGDLSVLQSVTTPPTVTGNTMTRSINGKKVVYQEVKVGDSTMYVGSDGRQLPAAVIESNTQPYEAAFDSGTPEYRERRSRATTRGKDRFEEIWKAEDRYRIGENEWKTTTNIKPQQAADEFWSWAEDNGIDPESDEALQIMTNAYQQAIADGKSQDNISPRRLKPYLDQQRIRESVGDPTLFLANSEAVQEGKAEPRYVSSKDMTKLIDNAGTLANTLPGNVTKDQVFAVGVREWAKEGNKDLYEKKAKKAGTSAFFVYMDEHIGKLFAQQQS